MSEEVPMLRDRCFASPEHCNITKLDDFKSGERQSVQLALEVTWRLSVRSMLHGQELTGPSPRFSDDMGPRGHRIRVSPDRASHASNNGNEAHEPGLAHMSVRPRNHAHLRKERHTAPVHSHSTMRAQVPGAAAHNNHRGCMQ